MGINKLLTSFAALLLLKVVCCIISCTMYRDDLGKISKLIYKSCSLYRISIIKNNDGLLPNGQHSQKILLHSFLIKFHCRHKDLLFRETPVRF